MFQFLIELLFSWLPSSLWLGVWAVLAAMFLIIIVKLLGIILDFFFRFIDVIKP